MFDQSEASSDINTSSVVIDNDYEEIKEVLEVNEIKTSSKFYSVAAVEQKSRKKKREYVSTRQKWYQKYSLDNGYLNQPSVEAVSEDVEGDFRPKIFDNIEKTWTLCDSGSVVSCIPKKPGDTMDPSIKLRSVNGGIIPTFGSKEIAVRIGRKEYKILAIKADIPQRILGWDFFRKYRIGLEWGPFGDLYMIDKKAKIKSLIKFEKPDDLEINSVDTYEEPVIREPSSKSVHFQTECMKNVETFAEATYADVNAMSIHPNDPSPIAEDLPLGASVDPDSNQGYEDNLKALQNVKKPFADLINQHHDILKSNFKSEPTSDIYHRIETTGEPFKSKVRPLLASSDKSEKGKKIWTEMEKLGVIERVKQNTTLQYTSPIHIVKKPNSNGWRVCADFRLLNQQTKSDNYPLPLLRSFQHKIKGSKVFSVIDLKSAFHHLPIHPDDVSKTCVLSPWGGAFVYRRLAFGLSNGPASWQKYVDGILKGIEHTFCYLDDILVATEDMEQHLSVVKQIFERLEEHGLTLALDKCTFAESTIDYLGYEVSETGIRPLKRKTDAIDKIPPPTTQKLLLQFLGALNYFRSSLSGLNKSGKYYNAANLLQPLYSAATVPIPSGKFKEIWDNSPVIQQAFLDAKLLLKQAAELSHPDPQLPLALMTDASQHSVGSVLLQRARNGKWTPLGYMSRHLPVDKARWSTCRKELLAAQAGLRYFITEIYGRHCTIFSDHAPLVLAFQNPQGFQLHDPVAQRALVEIGQFTKDVRHIAGMANVGSDFLSRIPATVKGTAYDEDSGALTNEANKIAAIEGYKLIAMSPTVIAEAQAKCKEIELIKAGRHPTSVTFQPVEFDKTELLSETSLSNPRPVIPKELRNFIMKQMHFCHQGIKETVRHISSYYYWHEMKKEITNFVQSCHACQSTKSSKTKPPHYGEFKVPDQRFTHCHVDIVGPLPESDGYRYILSIIDRTTRHLTAIPLAETSAKTCSQAFLLHYVALYGVPSACTSDQGKNFVSSLFQEMQANLGIDVNHTPIYWPQGNGLLERNHNSLKDSIKAQLVEMGETHKGDWIKYLPWALLGRRVAFNKDLGTSSSELTLGTHISVPGCILPDAFSEEPDINDVLEKLQLKNNRTGVPTSTNVQKEVPSPPDSVDQVYARQHGTKGLQPRYQGPFKVLRRPTRSSLIIKVGLNNDRSDRTEYRSWADCKSAYLREGAQEAAKPKRGRPPKKSSDSSVNSPVDQDASPNVVSTNNNNVTDIDSDPPFRGFASQSAIDFSRPPPPFKKPGNLNALTTHAEPAPSGGSASPEELNFINASISTRRV